MHDAKDTFLHLSSVLSTEDDHLHAPEIDLDGGRRCHALRETVGRELTCVVDDEIWFTKVCQFLFRGSDEHVVLEKVQEHAS